MSLLANGSAEYIVVPVGTAALNDSIPDAKVGIAIVNEAKVMLVEGVSARDALARLMVKWGAAECIQALAMCVGQENFRRAVEAGRLYGMNVDEEWEDTPA